ncbi:MAG: hypothetical protein ACRD1T_24150 [Acidimicrobiia bacterium]
MITRVELLSSVECECFVSALHTLQEHWIPHRPCGFFTFGAASYLDDLADYRRIAAAYNPLLRERFGSLLDRVRNELARHLAAPVRFDDNLARLGFHVWRVPALFTGAIHFDLQYQRLDWPTDVAPDFDHQISFTLPLRLPRRGGGLNMWDFTYEQVCRFYAQTGSPLAIADLIAGLAALKKPVYHPYTPGTLVLHSGHLLHQIAPVAEVDPDDERITLQGHGLCCAGEWCLYW